MKYLLLSIVISLSLYSRNTFSLTPAEKEWIKNNPVVTYSEVDWKPLSIIQNNKMGGVLGDYLNLISLYSGLEFKYIKSSSWSNVLENFKHKKIDIIPGIGSSQQETALGLVSDKYAQYAMVIVTKDDYSYIEDLKHLDNKRVALPKNYTSYNFVLNNYPNIKIIPTQSIEEALRLVELGQADAFVGHIATALYYIKSLNFSDLKICGTTKFMFEHHYLVQKDKKILFGIISKSLANITQEQKNDIYTKWIKVKVQQQISWEHIAQILFVAFAIILALVSRQITLSRYNKQLREQAYIIDQINECVISTDLDGIITEWNFGSQKLLEYTAQEMIGQSVTKLYLEEDVEDLVKTIERLKEDGTGVSETRLVSKSGKILFVELSLSLVRDANQNPIGMIAFSRDISQRKLALQEIARQKDELDYLAHHDGLTGLANRALFLDRVEQTLYKAKRVRSEVAILYIDLDMFKQINDLHGHAMGDNVLKEVAFRLKSVIRESDTLARLGGDEFSIIIEGHQQVQNASMMAEKIINILEKPLVINTNVMYIYASIGISIYPKNTTDVNKLLAYADSAMYKAKEEGRNNYQFYSLEMTKKARLRSIMQVNLRDAIVNKEFVIYFLPQIDVEKNKVVALEALIRWKQKDGTLIMPDKFIEISEEIGLLVEIDRWMIETAIIQAKKWSLESLEFGQIALNLTYRQLMTDKFIDWLSATLAKNDLDAKYICFEITEEDIMKNSVKIIDKLNQLSSIGIGLAIDDFGAWYSSISTLKKLPINKLKLDRTFISQMGDCKENIGVTKAIIDLSNSLNLDVVAEGVEDKEQRNFLVASGCNEIQGYLYSKPILAEDVPAFIKSLES